MSKRIILAAIAAFLLSLGVTLPAEAQVPGKNGLLVFTSSRDGNNEIYTATRTGNTVNRLTDNPASDFDASFSPDGTKIAFVSDRDGDNEIYVMNADGSGQTRITNHAGDDMDPAWSPDGERLAIRRNISGNNEIFLIDATDGGNPVNLTDHAASDFEPDFSPDGSKIVFQRYSGSGSGVGLGNEVFVMNADGSGQTNLTENSGSINDGRPSFSPDGSRIAFDSNRNDSRFEIYTMDPDGTDVSRLTNEDGNKQNPIFSPAGDLIAFSGSDGIAGIGLVPVAGGAISMITADEDSVPHWGTDSTAPVTSITGGPADASTATVRSAEFTFTADEDEATFECRIDPDDGGEWTPCTSPRNYTDLIDGEHSFAVRATDLGGNVEATPASRTWQIDATVPVVTIDSGPGGTVTVDSATIEFTVDDASATVECRLDSSDEGDWAACSSPLELTGLGQGTHTLEVRASDAVGNVSEIAERTWTIDSIAPSTTIDTAPAATSNSVRASFEFSADEPGVSFECRIDSTEPEGWAACESPVELDGLADGEHSFEVRATDAAGNAGAAVSHTWEVATVKPVASITAGPSGPVADTTAVFEFESDLGSATFECRLDPQDDDAWTACASPATFEDLAEGEHLFEVRATDLDQGTGPVASSTWTVDTAAPVVTIDSGPSGTVAVDTATTTFTVDDPGAATECRLDSIDEGDWAACSSPYELTALGQGEHSLEVRATDAAGNVSSIASVTWTVDTIAPVTTIDAAPPAQHNSVQAAFEFSADEGEVTFECRLDSDEASAWESCVSPAGYTNLTDGEHTFEVRATDAAGNIGALATHTWEIATVKPVATIDAGPTGTVASEDATFEFSSGDPAATFECRLDSEDPGDWAACASPQVYTGLAQGEHTFEVRASETDQGTGPIASQSWSVDTVAPVITFDQAPPAFTSSSDAVFEYSTDDPEATIECRLHLLPDPDWSNCLNSFETSGLDEGTYAFDVRATDQAGNASVATHTWTIDQTAPTATIDTAPPAVNNSIRATFEFSADESPVSFECRLDSSDETGWEECVSPFELDELTDGEHTFEVRPTDAAGNVGAAVSHTWEVATVKPVASITAGPSGPVADTTAVFEFESDLGSAIFECRIDAEEDGDWAICTSPATFEDLVDGEHLFEVRATDIDQGTGPVASSTWTVDTVTPTVELTGTPAPISGTSDPEFAFVASEEGTTAECRLDAVDENDPWLECSSPASYTGLSEGHHLFEVRVTDAAGHVSSPVAYDWIVETTPPDVTVTSELPESPTTFIDASFSFESGNLNAYFECRFDGGDWEPCSSPYTVDQLGDGTHTFEVRAVGYGAGPGPVQEVTWIVDTVVPAVVITSGPDEVTVNAVAEFGFETNKPGFTFQCSLNGGSPDPCTSPTVVSGLTAGEHSFRVDALDGDGQVVDSATREWTVLAAPPEVTVTGAPASLSGSSTAAFQFSSPEPAARFECQLDGGSWQACTSPVAFTGLADGNHTVRIRTVLGGPSAPTNGPVAEHTWQVDTTAPEIRIVGGPNGTVTTGSASFNLISDDPSATTECSLDGGAWQACGDPVSLAGLGDGSHELRVRSVDAAGNTGIDRREWSVDSVAPVVSLTGTPEVSTTDRTASFDFSADEAGVVFECSLNGGDWSACSPVHSVSGLDLGEHEFRVRAIDQRGNTGEPASFSWSVVRPPFKGLVPTVKFQGTVRLDRDGTARLARINCPEGSCRVTAPKRVAFRIRGRKGTPGIKVIRTAFTGRTEATLISSPRVRRLLARFGPVRIKVRIKVVSENGKSRTVTKRVRLTARR